MALTLTAVLVMNDDLAGTGNHHQFALAVGHITHRGVEADVAVGLGFDAGRNRRTRGRTTDVEGPHGQLGAGLANRLGGNHTDRLAAVDQTTTAQIAAVTTGANAKAGFAGERGAHLDFVDAGQFQLVDHVFIEHGAGRGQHRLVLRVQDVIGSGTTQNAVAQ